MGKTSTNFYEEILKANDYYTEKQASEEDVATGDMLEAFETEELEALASELHIAYEKSASASTSIEEKVEKVAELTGEQREQQKEDIAATNAQKAEGDTVDPDEEPTGSEQEEENKTKQEREQIVNPEAKAVEQESNATAGKEDAHLSSTASEYEEGDLIKTAYEVAEEKLAESGYSISDYVYTVIPNEKTASFIADKAEKLAHITNKSALQVADDIIGNMADILNSNQ